jgi:hypothetical protein
MTGRNDGVVGRSIVESIERVGRWIEKYEEAVRKERELGEQLRKIDLLLEEAKKAKYLIDIEKMQQQKKEKEYELKTTREKRLKLEWLAVTKIKEGKWDPEAIMEYEFIKDLLLLNRIRKEQAKEICQSCEDCKLIRVRTDRGETPLEAVTVKSRGIPYLPIYKLVEIRESRLKEWEVKETPLGALTSEERKEIEKRIREKLALSKNVLNCFVVEKKVPLNEEVVLKHRKYGCHRKLPRWLPIVATSPDSNPRAPDHFPGDIVAEVGEDGSYTKVYISSKHGSEESE